MTPLQEHCLTKLNKNSLANIEFFRKNLPILYDQILAGSPGASVDVSDQGDLSIRYDDGRLESIAKYMVEMEGRVQSFDKLDTRPQLIGFQDLRTVQVGEVGHGIKQSFHYSNLDAYYPNLIKKHFVEHYSSNEGLLKYPEFGDKVIPILIVVGCGLGWHLERLLMQYKIRHMIIMETDVERFRLSVFFQDYVRLSRLAIERDTSLSFIVDSDVEELTRTVVHLVQISLPPCFVHGAGLFYALEDDASLDAIKKTLPVTLWQVFFGLGYFDDELISIKHTFANLKNGVPVYTHTNVVPDDAVAFVIGSGPSLDELKPLLKKYSDRAVLFSCGTSLPSLAHDDICPDFHVEKERPDIVHEMIHNTVDADFLRRVNFIGCNVVHPDVFDLFKNRGMVFKTADTSVSIMAVNEAVDKPIINMQPTVTNAALNIAISMGFKKIYLVGVDFGYIDKAKHHSEHTVYFKKLEEEGRLSKLFSRKKKSNLIVNGNFGGEVFTTNVFNFSRISMEKDLASQPEPEVYNLNYGAHIEGAIPLDQAEFACEFPAQRKQQVVDAMLGAFSVIDCDSAILGARLLDQIDDFISEIESMLTEPLTNKTDVLKRMEMLYRFVFSVNFIGKAVNPLFRGSILYMMAYSYQMLSMIADEGEAAAKAEYDFGIILDHMQHARSLISETFAEMNG